MSLLPSRRDYAGLSRSWRGDLLAGVTVAVVALPLALAFGVSAGLGAGAGLVTAIVAGAVAAVFGGSDLQVSGPTGAMTVVLMPIVARHGADGVLLVGLLAGVAMLAAGLGRLGRYVAFIPWPVIEGFTVGIAVVILLQQVPSALGVSAAEDGSALEVAWGSIHAWGGAEWLSLAVAAGVGGALFLLQRIHRSLPASLLAVAAATAVAEFADWGIDRIGAIPSSLPAPRIPSVALGDIPTLASAVFAVAILAGIESLLSAKVADGMVDGRDHHPDRELLGQGIANIATSLFGGMPATGAIARTAVNAKSGATTRVAALTHAIVLLAVVVFLGGFVAAIPLAALAGVLIVTALRMIDVAAVRQVLGSTRSDAAVMVVTALTTVVFDLVVAVEVGVVLASFLALRAVARATTFEPERVAGPVDVDRAAEHELLHEHIVTYRLDGALFFGAAERFLLELTAVSDVKVVILRLGQLQVLDATGAQALGDIVSHLQARGIAILLCSVRPRHRLLIDRVGVLDALAHENHLLPSIEDALVHARLHVTKGAVHDVATSATGA